MTLENSVRLLAGTFVLLSVALGYFISLKLFLMTIFVGLNLVQSSFIGFCQQKKSLAALFSKNRLVS